MADYFETETQLSELKRCVDRHGDTLDHPTLPSQESIKAAEASLPSSQSASYLAGAPAEAVVGHITRDILPALNGQGRSGRYYGFVTGGALPVSQWADGVVSHMDQNVQVHLPAQTVATAVEDKALEMLASLLRLGRGEWPGRTLTTGATGSNVLGLACGREAVLARRLGDGAPAVGELGILGACVRAGVEEIQVLTSAGHSSLSKAASVVGLGRQSVKELQLSDEEPWRLDFAALEEHLKRPRTASIIAISAGEVNTGRYGTYGLEEMKRVRALADQYGAWIHVDGAFGIFARVLEANDEYKLLHERVAGLELADSITVDGHKVLNVPYDCGMFFSRSLSTLQNVFVNPNAAYLASSSAATIPSPLNVGLENSRRFRALPAYAALLSEGRPGFAKLVSNMVQLSRRLAAFLRDSDDYELLPNADLDEVFIIVLFRAKNPELNGRLVEEINQTRQMYVSGTAWKGDKAVRVAVSNWKVDVERDFKVVTAILTAVAEGRPFDIATVE